MYRLVYWLTFLLVLFPTWIYSFELVRIQAVSESGQTFVTRNGKEKGIFQGQESTFSTDEVTITAEAEEVSRDYALWKIKEKKTRVPFKRFDTVVMNENLESIHYQIPMARVKEVKPKAHLIFKGGFHQALTQSIDQVSTTEQVIRRGFQYTILVHAPVRQRLYMGVGLRLDTESARTSGLKIPTQRYFVLSSAEYHFADIDLFESTLYIGGTIGVGWSRTKVLGETQEGYAILAPAARIGMNIPLDGKWTMIAEAQVENVIMREQTPAGLKQSTAILNGKAMIGGRINF